MADGCSRSMSPPARRLARSLGRATHTWVEISYSSDRSSWHRSVWFWCRRSEHALFFLLWIAVNVGLVAVSGFGGARLRAPFEPHLMVLGAIALCGARLDVAAIRIAPAICVSALLGWVTLSQVPTSPRDASRLRDRLAQGRGSQASGHER